MKTETVPVLIAGAGPTGLTMANLLARLQIPFLLLDKKKSPSKDSKAFAIQARSLEIFDRFGIAEKAMRAGNTNSTLHLLVKNKEAGQFRFGHTLAGKTKYPYLLILPQDKTESLLIEALEEQGHHVCWQQELVKFMEQDSAVLATIREPSGEEKQVKAQYLLGCDGAGSTVREQAGISFKGKTFAPVFYLADCELEWQYPHGDIYFMLDKRQLSALFSYQDKNRYRLFNFINTVVDKEDGALTLEEVHNILATSKATGNINVNQVTWSSAFRIHSRLAASFRKGRVFLAGDAAHVHSPAGGQGMNTGIQDADNLAWKLAYVVKGMAEPALLNSYQQERYQIAKNLHKTTDRFFDWMVKRHRLANLFRLHVFPALFRVIFGFGFLRKRAMRRISQIAIKYPDSTLSRKTTPKGLTKAAPRAGDRAPYAPLSLNGEKLDTFQLLSSTQFTLFVAFSASSEENEITEASMDSLCSLPLSVHLIKYSSKNTRFFRTYGIRKNALFLIRPDGYIALRTAAVNKSEVKKYFQEILGRK